VYGLYEDVDRELSVPMVVYDNPSTTGFEFTDELYTAVTALPQVAAIKLPGVPTDPGSAKERVAGLRDRLPQDVALG
ncbi:dihydrodipicolinate synthase family protein, partial [Bacillus cereus]|nr:dihydrodipicolinate synthase family protein [Bacillus cereus]